MANIPLIRKPDGTFAEVQADESGAIKVAVDQVEGKLDALNTDKATATNQATANTHLSNLLDATKRRLVPADATVVNGSAAAASGVIYAGPTTLRTMDVINTNNGIDYTLMVFNATSLPSDGATPKWRRRLPRAGSVNWDGALALSTGAVWAISTTPATLTVSVASDAIVDASHGGT